MSLSRLSARVAIFASVFFACQTLWSANNWPQWRGPLANGHSLETNVPLKWNEQDVVWKAEIDGRGQSSPVIWGDRIFLTSALEEGRHRVVMCLDRKSGRVLWQQTAWTGEPEPSHTMNMHASPTCATDGRHVVAFFGRGGIHCYDFDGNCQWSVDLGPFEGRWGTGASPIIVGDLVIQNCDAEGDSYLVALDKRSGRQVWRTARPNLPRGGWSTPLLIDVGSRQELVLNGEPGVRAYDPKSGGELWFCKSFNGRGTPTPVFAHGLLMMVNGLAGDLYAVRPGGSGNVSSTHMAWHSPRKGGRDLPSPIVVGQHLFVVNLRPGIATCYEATTGQQLSQQRLGGNFSASPVAANGLIYVPNESGETLVIRPGREMEIVARNTVGQTDGEIFRSSLAISDGQVFCRSDRALYCITSR